ncbi:flagellar M-ring protein FliF C-terminal domain-containing protein [Acidocella sp. MX-AZ03]|uniref:flagellar M-ring protein FliF C-terminal domain-containing protein n=1 Tax=Acidocella sp. MX-AZ03 TaxID=2697363 RepID=UPI003FA40866
MGAGNFQTDVSAQLDFTRTHIQQTSYGPTHLVAHSDSKQSTQTGPDNSAIGIPARSPTSRRGRPAPGPPGPAPMRARAPRPAPPPARAARPPASRRCPAKAATISIRASSMTRPRRISPSRIGR